MQKIKELLEERQMISSGGIPLDNTEERTFELKLERLSGNPEEWIVTSQGGYTAMGSSKPQVLRNLAERMEQMSDNP